MTDDELDEMLLEEQENDERRYDAAIMSLAQVVSNPIECEPDEIDVRIATATIAWLRQVPPESRVALAIAFETAVKNKQVMIGPRPEAPAMKPPQPQRKQNHDRRRN